MARKIVPLRPRPKKDASGPVTEPPKGRTLADITVLHRHLDEVTRLTGGEVAQLIEATRPDGARPPFVSVNAICEELDGLSELVMVLGAADYADCGLPLDHSLNWIGESLRRLSQRLLALQQQGSHAPTWYAVEVTK